MIEFQKVSKDYPSRPRVLENVSFQIESGEMVFLWGASGAGKSTLLKLIAAMEKPSSGQVLLGNQDITQLKPAALPYLRRRIGLIFQQQRLLPDRTVLANVMLPLMVTGCPLDEAEKRAAAALTRVGLDHKAGSAPPSLSGGEQQLASIARAIVHRPQIILADEPTANLDKRAARRIVDTLRSFHGGGVTCIMATHDDQFLDGSARVIELRKGRMREKELEA